MVLEARRFIKWLRTRVFWCDDCVRFTTGIPVRIPGSRLLFCSIRCSEIAAGRLGLVQPQRAV